jgi:hypothetical protein
MHVSLQGGCDMKKTVLAVFVLLSVTPAQTARWTWTYNGPAAMWDQAWRIRCGPDSGVYVCGDGQANAIPLTFEMTAAALTGGGNQRWVYRFTGPGSRLGQAYDLAVTSDHNLVVAGTNWDIVTANDFAVLGVSDSGVHRWAYRIVDSGIGIARAVVCDRDGNAYACGTTEDYGRFTVASLSPGGAERWLWSSELPGEAMAIALDSSGHTYAAGYVAATDTTRNFSVWQLAPPDSARGLTLASRSRDTAVAVAVGSDGNVYAAGHMNMGATGSDIAVVSIDTNLFSQRWFYSYDHAGGMDRVQALLCGRDGNVYVAGFSFLADSVGVAFIVLSLTGDGQFRWVYSDTGGRAAAFNVASGLAEDADGNVYACGMLAGTESTRMDAVVTSLTSGGGLRWRYLFAGPDTVADNFGSIAAGPDGNLYACGTTGDPPNSDWVVVSLTASGAVAEPRTETSEPAFRATTLFRDRIALYPPGFAAAEATARLRDVAGRTVLAQRARVSSGRVLLDEPALAMLGPGAYFLELDLGTRSVWFKVVKVH